MRDYLYLVLILSFIFLQLKVSAQTDTTDTFKEKLDSIFISETENASEPEKVLHAEPLFIDLIRDLGARKGEKEWNVGFGMTDNYNYDSYSALVEYEFAPVNRLGLEIELPFTFYYLLEKRDSANNIPRSKLDGIKTAIQWSFFVSEKLKTSMALGYINELELPSFKSYNNGFSFYGNKYNPFFVAAKRWGNNFHTLLYTGPVITQHFSSDNHNIESKWQINSNFHYMISGTRNFIGVEINKEISDKDFDMTIRPQMRVSIAENLLIGIVSGIPIYRENQRFSSFVRLIYEPGHH